MCVCVRTLFTLNHFSSRIHPLFSALGGGAGSPVAQAFLELSMEPGMTLNVDPPVSTSGTLG